MFPRIFFHILNQVNCSACQSYNNLQLLNLNWECVIYSRSFFWNCYVIFHFRNKSLICTSNPCLIWIKRIHTNIFFGLENSYLDKADMWVTFKWYTQTFWCAVWQFDWAGMTGQIHHHLRRKIALHNGLASFLKTNLQINLEAKSMDGSFWKKKSIISAFRVKRT